jgi:hypothetical protein
VGCGVALLVLGAGGCAGAAREAHQLGSHSIVEGTRPLFRNQVKPAEIDGTSDAAGVKTLLQFWTALQGGDFNSAVGYIDRAYLDEVGASRLQAALRQLTPLWDSSKPTVSASTIRGGTAVVYFNLRDLQGNVGAAEVAFRRLGSTWRISFFSLLPKAPSA